MIDAYTIGITLALDDGVSEGIKVVRRELATLDRAIAGTAAGLRALSLLGQQVGLVTSDAARPPSSMTQKPEERPAVDTQSLAPDLTLPSTTIVAPGAVSSDEVQRLFPPKAPAAPTVPMRETEPPVELPARPDSGFTPRSVATGLQNREPSPPAKLSNLRLPAIASIPVERPLPAVRVSDLLPPAAPDKTPLAPKSAAEFAPRPPNQDRQVPPEPSVRAPPIGVALPPILVQRAPRMERSEEPRTAPSSVYPLLAATEPSAAPHARLNLPTPNIATGHVPREVPNAVVPRPAPQVTLDPGHPRREMPATHHSHSEPSRPRPSEERHEAPPSSPSGEIVLDGIRLGRWMGDALAKMVDRPNSGSIGIDPRATPLWPAMQGY
ncbi:MAG: hypothetical protein ABI369_13720 [Acetobacteraceae bacterium]